MIHCISRNKAGEAQSRAQWGFHSAREWREGFLLVRLCVCGAPDGVRDRRGLAVTGLGTQCWNAARQHSALSSGHPRISRKFIFFTDPLNDSLVMRSVLEK